MAEYLRLPEYEWLPKVGVEEMVKDGRVLAPGFLGLVMEKAYGGRAVGWVVEGIFEKVSG